jgi:tetratricopeptide (TPR) repeat protein
VLQDDRLPNGWRPAVIVACITAAIYAPLIGAGYVWDDWTLVAGGGALGGRSGIIAALREDLYAANVAAGPSGYWRPLATLSFWINGWLGHGPGALHAGNVALHALAAGLLTLFLVRVLGGATLPAALAAILWALHPEQVEAVAWISCRYELLTAVAALGCLLSSGPGARRAILTGAIFLAGLLSKEGFVALAPVLVVQDWASGRAGRASWARWGAVAAAVACWFLARNLLGIASISTDSATLTAMPARALAAIALYAGRAVAPTPLSIHHAYIPEVATVAAGGVIVAALIALSWRRREWAPAAALFAVSLLPSSIAMARIGVVAERYFYVPSLGLAWISSLGLARLLREGRPQVKRAVVVAVVVAVLACIPFTVGRFRAWRDDDALFLAALEVDPKDSYAHLHFGRAALAAGRLDEAGAHLEQSFRSDPGSAEAADGLAELALRTGRFDAARDHAARAVALEPSFALAWVHLSWACHETGKHQDELASAEQAVRLAPEFFPARITASLARCELERSITCERPIDDLVSSGALDPATALMTRISAALRRGDESASAARIDELRRTMPDHPELPRFQMQLEVLRGR